MIKVAFFVRMPAAALINSFAVDVKNGGAQPGNLSFSLVIVLKLNFST